MALGSNNFQGSITFNVDQAVGEIKKLQDQIDKWTTAMENTKSPAVFNSFEKMVGAAKDRLAELEQQTQKTGNAIEEKLNVPATSSFRAMTKLDSITREFASGSMQAGTNGLVGFGNAMARMVTQSGSVGGALESMGSAIMGPMGIVLGLSLIIGLISSNKDAIINFFSGVSESELETQKATQNMRDAFESNLKTVGTTITQDEALIKVISDVTISTDARREALRQLKEEHKGNIELQKTDINDGAKLINIINDMANAYKRKAEAEAYAKVIGEEYAKKIRLETASIGEQIGNVNSLDRSFAVWKATFTSLNPEIVAHNAAVSLIPEAQKNNQKEIKATSDTIETLTQKYAALTKEQFKQSDYKITNDKGTKAGPTKKESVDTSTLETLKKEQQLYKDDIYAFKDYGDLIVKEEERIALEKARINKASANQIKNIQEQARIGLELNQKNLGLEIMKIAEKNTSDFEKKEKQEKEWWAKMEMDSAKDRLRIIKDSLQEELKEAGKNYDAKRLAIEKAMAQTMTNKNQAVDPKVIKQYAVAYEELEKQLKLVNIEERNDTIKKREAEYKKFAETTSKEVTNGLMTMYAAMQKGENPLQALGDMIAKLVEQLAAAVVQALIFQTIMSALGMGGVESGGLGSIGGAIGKVFGFADGGVVSQPTLMMAGEGGQSEAIMPLNKLGKMMNNTFSAGAMSGESGNGGSRNGQFVLKGNDLVLALQRSNYSLNLRRGS